MRTSIQCVLVMFSSLVSVASSGAAQLNLPFADGSDGVFAPTVSTTVDLALATTGSWTNASPNSGRGIYDPEKWAVVFKYSSVSIPNGVTVYFGNHPSGAPVVWLVNGAVSVGGTINLDGQTPFRSEATTVPGPGGFRGGNRRLNAAFPESAGFGPGGGGYTGSPNQNGSGGYSTYGEAWGGISGGITFNEQSGRTYGNTGILPLIGGSGGAGNYIHPQYPGGAGGGAILVATPDRIRVDGQITANGGGGGYWDGRTGSGGGSGGAIRLLASEIVGGGSLTAYCPVYQANSIERTLAGGIGRIRLECFTTDGQLRATPATVTVAPDAPPTLWPTSTSPRVRVLSVGGSVVPDDPRSSMDTAPADAAITNLANAEVVLETVNANTNWFVFARVVPKYGANIVTPYATAISSNANVIVWRTFANLPKGFVAIQARAVSP